MSLIMVPPRLDGVLGGGYPAPVDGVILADSEYDHTTAPGTGAGCHFIIATTGVLQFLLTGDTTFSAFDTVQWHEERPTLTTNPPNYYGVRANGATYTGSGNRFQFSFYDLITTYATTPTPWVRVGVSSTSFVIERPFFSTGADSGTVVCEICKWSDKSILQTATFTMTDRWL